MKIIMVDQDGVICNKDYQATCDIKTELLKCKKEKILLIPNSDTPTERLINNFSNMINFTASTVIAEKGAVIHDHGNIFKTIFSGKIESTIASIFQVFNSENCIIEIGDSATWIRENRTFKKNKKILLIDGYRKSSLAFYALQTGPNGIPQINSSWFKKVSEMTARINVPENFTEWDINLKYGIIILHHKNASKTLGYEFFKKKYHKAKFYMVGDGDIDIIDSPDIVHCGIKNSSNNFKDISVYCSNKPHTKGLKDVINWILKN